MTEVIDAFRDRYDVTVDQVDWRGGSRIVESIEPARSTDETGEELNQGIEDTKAELDESSSREPIEQSELQRDKSQDKPIRSRLRRLKVKTA